jgi:hypothetical protein
VTEGNHRREYRGVQRQQHQTIHGLPDWPSSSLICVQIFPVAASASANSGDSMPFCAKITLARSDATAQSFLRRSCSAASSGEMTTRAMSCPPINTMPNI